jgi:hypothetical protein
MQEIPPHAERPGQLFLDLVPRPQARHRERTRRGRPVPLIPRICLMFRARIPVLSILETPGNASSRPQVAKR